MSTFSSNVMSALDTFNEDYSQARASTGGVQRPIQGEWDNILSEMTIESEGETMRIAEGVEIPAILVGFKYKLLGGGSALPPEMKQGQEWPGRTFILPACGIKGLPASVTKGKRESIRINLERLKGHLQTILGTAASGVLGADLGAAKTLIDNKSAAVAVRVKCQYRKDDKDNSPTATTYFDEFLMKKLS